MPKIFGDSYLAFVKNNVDKVIFEFVIAIDDATMRKSYILRSNVHCDTFYCTDSAKFSMFLTKKKYNRAISELRKTVGKRINLSRTSNGLGYTRLIYRLC